MNQHVIALIAEDDAIGDSLHMLLASHGYRVQRLPLGASSLDALETRTFGCLVVGQFGPSLPGLKLLAELRGRGNRTRGVLVTNDMDEQDYRLVDSLGGISVLEKPLEPAELLARVGQHKPAGHTV